LPLRADKGALCDEKSCSCSLTGDESTPADVETMPFPLFAELGFQRLSQRVARWQS
jgi:hypothetical protein